MGSFDYRIGEEAPIGTVLQSPINLEQATRGKWIELNGRDCNRSDWPELSPLFNAGVFTGTVRTPAATPVSSTIANDDTNFLCAGPVADGSSNNCLLASADGVTLSWVSFSWTSGTSPSCIIYAGSRFIMAGTGGDLTVPYVTNATYAASKTVSNLTSKSLGWTATTGGATTTRTGGMAYSPQLGRTVLINESSGTAIYTLEDGSTTWVSRSHTTARTKVAVVWTGEKFLITTADNYGIALSSTDGITWVEQYAIYLYMSNVLNPMASNGNGVVVVAPHVDHGTDLIVSIDHGSSWRKISVPASSLVTTYSSYRTYTNFTVHYVNGKFIAMSKAYQSSLISIDGLSWQEEPLVARVNNLLIFEAIAYKAGIYCAIRTSGSSSATFTEDMSRFHIPATAGNAPSNSANYSDTMSLHMEYMKARSK